VVVRRPGLVEQAPPASWRKLFERAYLAEDRDFVRCIREGDSPRATGTDGKMAVLVANSGNESIRTGRPVQLPKGART
jgi:predicted dehydrogenase